MNTTVVHRNPTPSRLKEPLFKHAYQQGLPAPGLGRSRGLRADGVGPHGGHFPGGRNDRG
jgi:hypothetical protein